VQNQVAAPDVVISGAKIDPISEAGGRILNKVGLETVADGKIQPTLDSVRAANAQTTFALQTPADAAVTATNIALRDNGVQRAICASSLQQAPGSQIQGDGGAAGASVSVSPTFPELVQVGNTNVPVALAVGNASTPPENGGLLTVSQIRLTPACGTDVGFDCPQGSEDPNVFVVRGFGLLNKAQGRAGTACGDPSVPGGMTFTIGRPDVVTGQVELIPDLGAVVLQSPGTPGMLDTCTIDFFVDVVSLPVHDADPAPGVNSIVSAFACGTTTVNRLSSAASSETIVTVIEPTPRP
jgi:hypothetical protein